MPKKVADELIANSGGSVDKLEHSLGLSPGDLGDAPIKIDINNPEGLRMLSGNEFGANSYWLPGGRTSGGIPEATIEPVKVSEAIINPVFKK